MTAVRPYSKQCLFTNCFLQPTCAQQPLVPPPLQDTAILINEQPQRETSILDTITQSRRRLQGTPVSLKCGGDAFILNSGNHTLYLGVRTPTIARLATTINPEPTQDITTEVLLLAGHRIAPSGDMSFILKSVSPENDIPAAAIDTIPPAENTGLLKAWVLEESEWDIFKILSRLTITLPGIVGGVKAALTPDLSARASLSVFVKTGAGDPQMVTVDLQSTEREDGFWITEYLVENPFARIALVRTLKSLGFKQK